jgi:hypothetical protein
MDGRTILGLDGRYIARIWRPGERGWVMPEAARWRGRRNVGTWEIEGYGDTPAEAEADLRRRFKGKVEP